MSDKEITTQEKDLLDVLFYQHPYTITEIQALFMVAGKSFDLTIKSLEHARENNCLLTDYIKLQSPLQSQDKGEELKVQKIGDGRIVFEGNTYVDERSNRVLSHDEIKPQEQTGDEERGVQCFDDPPKVSSIEISVESQDKEEEENRNDTEHLMSSENNKKRLESALKSLPQEQTGLSAGSIKMLRDAFESTTIELSNPESTEHLKEASEFLYSLQPGASTLSPKPISEEMKEAFDCIQWLTDSSIPNESMKFESDAALSDYYHEWANASTRVMEILSSLSTQDTKDHE